MDCKESDKKQGVQTKSIHVLETILDKDDFTVENG